MIVRPMVSEILGSGFPEIRLDSGGVAGVQKSRSGKGTDAGGRGGAGTSLHKEQEMT